MADEDSHPKEDTSESSSSQERIRRYLSELQHLFERKIISENELQKLKKKYGLTTVDMGRIDVIAGDHFHNARMHIKKNDYRSAIIEWERGCVLRPNDLETLAELGNLYFTRFREDHYHRRDRLEAVRIARNILKADKSVESARDLLQEIALWDHDNYGSGRAIIPIALVSIFTAVLVFLIVNRNWDRLLLLFAPPVERPLPLPPPVSEERLLSTPVPVNFISEHGKGLRLETYKSSRRKTPLMYGYDFEAEIESPETNLDAFSVSLKYTAEDGTPLAQENFLFGGQNNPPLRRGDSVPLRHFLRLPGRIGEGDSVSVTVESVEEGGENLPPPKPILDTGVGGKARLLMNQRGVTELTATDRRYLFVDFDFEVSGGKPLAAVEMMVQWRDAIGKVVYSEEIALVDRETMPLMPGMRRVRRFVVPVPMETELFSPDDYTIHIEGSVR